MNITRIKHANKQIAKVKAIKQCKSKNTNLWQEVS